MAIPAPPYRHFLKLGTLGAGVKTQGLRILTTLPEDPGFILSTHMVDYNPW